VQEPEQEWCADQCGDDTNGDADAACDRVSNKEQECAADGGEREDGAWVGASRKPNKVRHDESNKADQPSERHGGGGCERGERHSDPALATHIYAKVLRRFVAKQESGERATAQCEECGGGNQWECRGGEAWPGCAIQATEQEGEDRAQIRTTGEHHQ
jgi:hypothetical protein